MADTPAPDPDREASTGEPAEPRETSSAPPPKRASAMQKLGRVAALVLMALFVVFALANAQHVDFSWVAGESTVVSEGGERVGGGVRLILLLIAAFVAGAVIGSVAAFGRARRRAEARAAKRAAKGKRGDA